MTEYFTSIRWIDGQLRKVIVDENGNIININPNKEELKELKIHIKTGPRLKYNIGDICCKCIEEKNVTNRSILRPGNATVEIDQNGNETGRVVCQSHRDRDDPNSRNNIVKSLRDRRRGNLDPNSTQAKGDKGENLLCEWKGYINLNKKHNNYCMRRDCLDEKTGEYYQAKISYYNGCWNASLQKEQRSIIEGFDFKALYLLCISKNGKIVERVYIIPLKEILKRSHIGIYRNPCRGVQWHEKYRITDKEELKKINEIWDKLNRN